MFNIKTAAVAAAALVASAGVAGAAAWSGCALVPRVADGIQCPDHHGFQLHGGCGYGSGVEAGDDRIHAGGRQRGFLRRGLQAPAPVDSPEVFAVRDTAVGIAFPCRCTTLPGWAKT